MIHAWYEKNRDQKDCLYFAYHKGKHYAFNRPSPFPSFHNSIEFAIGVRGSMEIVIDGNRQVLNAGEICFMDNREPHRYWYNPSVECYIVLISSSFFTDINQLGNISFPKHMAFCEGFDMLKQYLDYAIKTWNPESLLCKRAFADTFAYLMMQYYPHTSKKVPEKQNAVLLDAVKYICEHYTEKLTVGDVAAQFDYSPNHFSAMFNEFMGSSFPDYLNTCRMIEYQRLIREQPKLSAIRAAEMCGFGSMTTFYRALSRFKREMAEE